MTEILLPRTRTWLVVDAIVVVACDEDCCEPELAEAIGDDPEVPELAVEDPDTLPDELLRALCDPTAA